MNIVYYNDSEFQKTKTYEEYKNQNQGNGYLNIRAYAASSAIPISNLQVTISKTINNLKVIFFEGATDNSGTISQITLPTPLITTNDNEIPLSQEYDITTTYNDEELLFKIKMYSDIQVIQNINVVPNLRLDGNTYGN